MSDPLPPALPRLVRPLVVGVVLALGIYAALALLSDSEAVMAAARGVDTTALLLALLASTGNFVLRGLRWDLYLRRLDAGQVPGIDRWLVFLAGFSMSVTPGKVGELLKPALLHSRHGTSVAAVSSAVVAERITDLLGVALLLGIGALALPKLVAVAGLVWLGVAAALFVLVSPAIGAWVVSVVARMPVVGRFSSTAAGLLEALRALSRPATMVPALGLSLGAWGLQCASLWLVASGFSDAHLPVLESILAYTAPLLAGAVALVPGGVGVAEATMAGMVSSLADCPLPTAEAITVLVRGVTLWWAVLVGLGALLAWGITGRR